MPLSTEILHVTKIPGLRGAPVDRVEVCYKVSHSFCTSAILLVYQAMPCCRFVHGSALWCTKRCRMAVLYRGAPSGVPSDAARLFCTWERPLVYQAMPHGCFVHGSALWCTKRCRTAVLYMGAPSGVPSDAVLPFCTWERPLVYQAMPCCCFVQERGLWCTDLISCRMRCGDFVRKDEYLCVGKKRTLML